MTARRRPASPTGRKPISTGAVRRDPVGHAVRPRPRLSAEVATLREQYPDNPVLARLAMDSRLGVSEPLGDLRGAWLEVPDATCLIVHPDGEEMHPFVPTVEAARCQIARSGWIERTFPRAACPCRRATGNMAWRSAERIREWLKW